eukprot:7376015-Prymnesium_polylepis.3
MAVEPRPLGIPRHEHIVLRSVGELDHGHLGRRRSAGQVQWRHDAGRRQSRTNIQHTRVLGVDDVDVPVSFKCSSMSNVCALALV